MKKIVLVTIVALGMILFLNGVINLVSKIQDKMFLYTLAALAGIAIGAFSDPRGMITITRKR